MTKFEKEIETREQEMAEEIVLDHLERGEEIMRQDVRESLNDSRDARITYSPERVWQKIIVLAEKKRVPINRSQRRVVE